MKSSSFTTRGIVALVFSTICGILGVLVVIWYGLADDPAVPAAELAVADSSRDSGLVSGDRVSEGREGSSSGSGSQAGQEKQGPSMIQRDVQA